MNGLALLPIVFCVVSKASNVHPSQEVFDQAHALAAKADEAKNLETAHTQYAVAAELYRRAAEQGHHGAQMSLALLYANGEGVEKDLSQAVHWMEKAAESGDERAAHVAQMYRERMKHREPDNGVQHEVPLHGHGDTEL